MDKISGILPDKPRLKSESNASLTPVRPGAPAFGRAEGSAEIRDRVSLSTVKNIGPQEPQNYRNPKEAKNVKIVEDLSRKFFMNSAKEPATLTEVTTEPSTSSEFFPETPGALAAESSATTSIASGPLTPLALSSRSAPTLGNDSLDYYA